MSAEIGFWILFGCFVVCIAACVVALLGWNLALRRWRAYSTAYFDLCYVVLDLPAEELVKTGLLADYREIADELDAATGREPIPR